MDIEKLYRLYFKDVFLYLLSMNLSQDLAEEITQETFYKAIKSIDSFDGTKDIRAWLFTIAKNTYFSFYKKQKKLIPMESEDNLFEKDSDIVQKIENEEVAFEVHKFLHEMKDPYKEVFTLRVFGELPFEKIGAIFGKNSNWARVTFYRSKKMIREYLEVLYDEKN
ncbi:RNA polymerase sigma factor [Peptoniphilus sp.]|jgi:RNA polymerase sigma factor (sigma-70 family)|uniref:RNA polymerase sigma factor n=1 Tax=Peptoniphilus sp. TaxID=1971214 RepID=UPI003D8C1270